MPLKQDQVSSPKAVSTKARARIHGRQDTRDARLASSVCSAGIPPLFAEGLAAASDWRTHEFKKPQALIRLGSLFSGIGAVEHALERLGLRFQVMFAGDIDPHARETYWANWHVTEESWHQDVRSFDASPFQGQVDLLVGGSPCQSFSMVGDRLGLKDDRGTLFFEFTRVIRECKPKVFIYENVRGLVNHERGETWRRMQREFAKLGYRVFSEVLNAKDFGIPQHRERLFAIGFRNDSEDFSFPCPIELDCSMQDFLEDYTESKYYLGRKGVKFVTSSKNRLKRYTQINGKIALCQKANQQFNWHGDFVFEPLPDGLAFDEFTFDVREVEEKYYLSKAVERYVLAGGTKNFRTSTQTDLTVARPLLQSMHKMHRAGVDNYVTHSGRIRKLTPRECLRLMGFRDSFRIVVSDTQMYRQAGNSIVVDVLIAILKQMDISRFGVTPCRRSIRP